MSPASRSATPRKRRSHRARPWSCSSPGYGGRGDAGRRAGVARYGVAGAGNDGGAGRRLRPVRRLGVRPRCGGRRHRLAAPGGTRPASGDGAGADRSRRGVVRSRQRRRQDLGPPIALFRSRLDGGRARRARFCARQRRRRPRRDHLRPQRRARLGERRHVERLRRRRARRGQRGRTGDARFVAALLGCGVRTRRRVRRPRRGPDGRRRLVFAIKRHEPANTTLAVVATDAPLDKAQATHIATMATAGLALAMRPAYAPTDGGVVFAASTARAARAPNLRDLAEIGALAAECLARAVARGVYEATSLPFNGALPSWREKSAAARGAGPTRNRCAAPSTARSAVEGACSTTRAALQNSDNCRDAPAPARVGARKRSLRSLIGSSR